MKTETIEEFLKRGGKITKGSNSEPIVVPKKEELSDSLKVKLSEFNWPEELIRVAKNRRGEEHERTDETKVRKSEGASG